ncbi:MAG: TlyA family RNA methyltransferase, partial [Spirochaetes bacterium]|nr:TlyA family RNA methyltransferase [Spirochaetota bacterium]
MGATRKIRLDQLLAERGLAETRTRAQALIMAGAVRVGGELARKPGHPTALDAPIEVDSGGAHVSRGWLKLAHALDAFAAQPKDRVCIDIGASTGGFTQCLLDRGARRVYAVDSGTHQLHESLRGDKRVVVMENTNARLMEASACDPRPSLAVMDVSFISTLKIYPALGRVLLPPGELVSLVKPPFEAEPSEVTRGGRVTGPELHLAVISRWARGVAACGARLTHFAASPIRGVKSGNVEYLARVLLLPAGTEAPLPEGEL